MSNILMEHSTPWICCQLGARENYAIARALHHNQQLQCLVTDAWIRKNSPLQYLPISGLKGLTERYHPELENAEVLSFTKALILFEARERLQKTAAWSRMIARNRWYHQNVIARLEQISQKYPDKKFKLFTYSYAALETLKYAKSQGWTTVLGQIDPAIEEEKIVKAEFTKHSDLEPNWQSVPPEYWQSWREECELSDLILVNSEWSKSLLVKAGIPGAKVDVVPLVYTAPPEVKTFTRSYPEKFTKKRPLRVLFLGIITLRKGIVAVLEAIATLLDEGMEFWFVGSQQITIPASLRNHPNVHWVGSVPRSETAEYYRRADVFLFPTLSDGFGLTQLEAQAWGLPIIASPFCGTVVTDQRDGLVLPEVSGTAIASALLELRHHPEKLQQFSQAITPKPQFSLDYLGRALQRLMV